MSVLLRLENKNRVFSDRREAKFSFKRSILIDGERQEENHFASPTLACTPVPNYFPAQGGGTERDFIDRKKKEHGVLSEDA